MFKKQQVALLVALAIAVFCSSTLLAADFYIATDGNDTWSGTLAQPNETKTDGPLATLEAAKQKVRAQAKAGIKRPVNVFIRGGEYFLSETVVFTTEDSGTKNFPVTYRASEGERPVFTGGIKLTGWAPLKDDLPGIGAKAKGKLWYVDIPPEFKGKWQITTLYDGTEMLKRSQSKEFKTSKDQVVDEFNRSPKVLTKMIDWRNADPLVFSRELYYTGDDVKNWEKPSDIEVFLSPRNTFLVNMLPLEKIDSDKKIAHFTIDPTFGPVAENKYIVENALDYLDEPGEWIFDSHLGKVIIWPETDLASADIRAPYLQEFILLEGIEDKEPVRYLNFEGLTFRHGLRDTWTREDKGLQHDWEMFDKGNAMVRFRHVEHSSVKGCIFEASGGTGVRFDLYSQYNTVADSLFANLGGTGILLSGYAPGIKDENKYNTVTNNYIHHVGTVYEHSPAIFIAQSGHNLISHNTIHDLAYNGMVISGCRPHDMTMTRMLKNRREWVNSLRLDEIEPYTNKITQKMLEQWDSFDIDLIEPLLHARYNQIEYNEIYRVMKKLHDGNGIYFSGMGHGNRVEYNYFHDIYHSRGFLRLDDIVVYTYLGHNVGERGNLMYATKGPSDMVNNFCINTGRFMQRRKGVTHLRHNLIYVDEPDLAKHPVKGKGENAVYRYAEYVDTYENSIFYDPKPLKHLEIGDDIVPEEKRGKADVGMVYMDPMFDKEAMKNKNFTFLPGSPALELGIEPIDLSNVGSTLAP